jgi:5'-nucleotidase (lipoprotein e(P4) family)
MKKISLAFITLLLLGQVCAQDSPMMSTNERQEALMKEWPVLWQQQAAEYRALCYQAFNIAAFRLGQLSSRQLRKGRLAIITDLDETILDNSASEARMIGLGKTYSSQSWKEWTARAAATAVPGAVAFLQAAKQKGIDIFYVSNRDTSEIAITLVNLRNLQLPDADTAHALFVSNTSSKEIRRQTVMKDFNVIMLLGDNLNDFMQVFEGKSPEQRFAETDKEKAEWGKKFIVLPNATYGEWESAIYDYEKHLTPAQKEDKRRARLKSY